MGEKIVDYEEVLKKSTSKTLTPQIGVFLLGKTQKTLDFFAKKAYNIGIS